MKKVFALLLVMLLAITTLVACTSTVQPPVDDGNNPSVTPPGEDDQTPDDPNDNDESKTDIDLAKQLMSSAQISYNMVDEYGLNNYDSAPETVKNTQLANTNYMSGKTNVNTANNDFVYYTKEGYYDNYTALTSIKNANVYTNELGQTVEKYMKYLNNIVDAFDIEYTLEMFDITAVIKKIDDGCMVTIKNPNYNSTLNMNTYGNIKLFGITYTITMTSTYTLVQTVYDDMDLTDCVVSNFPKEWVQQTLLLVKDNGKLARTEFSYFMGMRTKLDLLKAEGNAVHAVELSQSTEGDIYYNVTNFKDSFAVCVSMQYYQGAVDPDGLWFDPASNKVCWTVQFFYNDHIIYNSYPFLNSVTLPAVMVDGWEQMSFPSSISLDDAWSIYGIIPNEIKFSNGTTETNLYMPNPYNIEDALIMKYMPVCSLLVIQHDGSRLPARGTFVSIAVSDQTLQQFYAPFFNHYGLSLKGDSNITNWFNTTNVKSLLTKQVAEDFELSYYVDFFAQYDFANADDLFVIKPVQ